MAKRSDFQKAVKKALEAEGSDIFADRIVCKANGTVEVMRSYYYRFGDTSRKWAERVHKALQQAEIVARVTDRDEYRHWPGTSYFVAVVERDYRHELDQMAEPQF